MFLKSWKTTVLGICSFIIGGLMFTKIITNEQGQVLMSLLVMLIGIFSKDGNVTGNTQSDK
jgi:hypothetical protein